MGELFSKKLAFERKGLMLKSERYWHTKDPCPVFDGKLWHIFGSGGAPYVEIWHILHATAPTPEGPWTEDDASILDTVQGPHVAAPGVIFDEGDKLFHMFIQREFMQLGGMVHGGVLVKSWITIIYFITINSIMMTMSGALRVRNSFHCRVITFS